MKIYYIRENSNFRYYKFTMELKDLSFEDKEKINGLINALELTLQTMEKKE